MLPEKIEVLFFAANPRDQEQLRLYEEVRAIEQKIRMSEFRDSVALRSRWAVRTDDLFQALNEIRPRVVHFSAHGSRAEELVFLTEDGGSQYVTEEAMAESIATVADHVRVVFFNTCYSRAQAQAAAQHVDVAIGMNDSIGDDAARVFAAQFYSAIGFGHSVRKAFDQAKAQLKLESIPEDGKPELFIRGGLSADKVFLVRPEMVDYSDYLEKTLEGLRQQLQNPLTRRVSTQEYNPAFRFPVRLKGSVDGETFSYADQEKLLQIGSSVVVLAEPGGGKTYLLNMLARDAILAYDSSLRTPVPVVLQASRWKKDSFATIAEGIYKALKYFTPNLTEAAVEEELRSGRFLLLIDGLDEVAREELGTLYSEMLAVSRAGTRIVATCRDNDYDDKLREQFGRCVIRPLTRRDVVEYAASVLGELIEETEGTLEYRIDLHLRRHLDSALEGLVRNPLLLMMTMEVMRTQPGVELPGNRADLYRDYVELLLTEQHRPSSRPLTVDKTVKERILTEYARLIWDKVPDDGALEKAMRDLAGVRGGTPVYRVRDRSQPRLHRHLPVQRTGSIHADHRTGSAAIVAAGGPAARF